MIYNYSTTRSVNELRRSDWSIPTFSEQALVGFWGGPTPPLRHISENFPEKSAKKNTGKIVSITNRVAFSANRIKVTRIHSVSVNIFEAQNLLLGSTLAVPLSPGLGRTLPPAFKTWSTLKLPRRSSVSPFGRYVHWCSRGRFVKKRCTEQKLDICRLWFLSKSFEEVNWKNTEGKSPESNAPIPHLALPPTSGGVSHVSQNTNL